VWWGKKPVKIVSIAGLPDDQAVKNDVHRQFFAYN
jgi:hypothetical protein